MKADLKLVVRVDGRDAPDFVHRAIELPAVFVGMTISGLYDRKGYAKGNLYAVHEVRWDESREQLQVFVTRYGDAHPLQPTLGIEEALALGWELDKL